MITLEDLLRRHATLTVVHVERWIACGLLQPEDEPPRFSDIDAARVELLIELRDSLAIQEEALEVVMGLVDQVHGLRRRLALLAESIARQPPEVREQIAQTLRRIENAT
jgi:chaperone modulatory protein CbpM